MLACTDVCVEAGEVFLTVMYEGGETLEGLRRVIKEAGGALN